MFDGKLCGLFLLSLIAISHSYHDQFDNKMFHTWMVEGANKGNSFNFENVDFVWLDPKPEGSAIQGKEFIVKYELRWKDEEEKDRFFQDMIDKGYLDAVNNVEEARQFCNTTCVNIGNADKDSCCVHHINIHSCPVSALNGDMCGPWIQDDGGVFTHTAAMATKIMPWETEVILNIEGENYIIAHIRIGKIQMALGHKMLVYPKPNCGDGYCYELSGENCENCKQDCCPGLSTTIIIVIIVISCLLLLALILIPAVWYYQKQKFLYDETWIVDWDNIKPSTGYKGFGSVRSIQSTMLSQTSMGQNGGINPPPVRGQIFCETGIFEGKVVSIKKIAKIQFQLNRATRVEIRNVRALDHMNLSKFMGIVTDIENFSIITEYCNKGSLNDVLLNDEIPLNWGFRLSFAQDVCRGMEYIHNHKMFHGRLKSSNCIIDDRWVCKITDFGLPNVRKPDEDPEMGEQFGSIREKRINRKGSKKGHFGKSSLKMNRRISGLLRKDVEAANETTHPDSDSPVPILLSREDKMNRVYRPPEANTDETQIYQPTTDVYSFGIILIEIGGRTEISPPEEAVYDPLWRPDLPDFEDHDKDPDNSLPLANKYLELIRHCWEEKPSARPTFTEIKKQLHNINPNKENPVDMMMKLMEKYSKHLESIVAERTHELVEEKKKTDRLLYAMLPKSVAEDLKQGNPIVATKYDACTIFFSDIVGFTNLSSSSTPLEVVELLNQMYTAFDSIIDEHDVYKVETIGDAYMVVSGVPEKNGERHAEEIATMALKIVCFCRGFRVPHRPNQIVNIRAGIHSGPVVTGVVGLKMPRYCLFGDTVNMASRMESTGEALKIQVSPDTYIILRDKGDQFAFEYRGEIEIKGKGTKKTHWLLGKRETGRQDLLIKHCLSPASHKRIFKGNRLVAKPNPLTPLELNEHAAPSAPKILAPLKAPPTMSPLLNGHSSIEEDLPPNYDSIVMTPLIRGVPERESSTSRDLLLGPEL